MDDANDMRDVTTASLGMSPLAYTRSDREKVPPMLTLAVPPTDPANHSK
jgi:hypothetical protein